MTDTTPPTFTEILDLWKSDRQVAEDLGLPETAAWKIRQWRRRNSVPGPYLPDLIQAFERRFSKFGFSVPAHITVLQAANRREQDVEMERTA